MEKLGANKVEWFVLDHLWHWTNELSVILSFSDTELTTQTSPLILILQMTF